MHIDTFKVCLELIEPININQNIRNLAHFSRLMSKLLNCDLKVNPVAL